MNKKGRPRLKLPDRRMLEEIYAEKKSIKLTAEHLNVSHGTVRMWLDQLNIPIAQQGTKRNHGKYL